MEMRSIRSLVLIALVAPVVLAGHLSAEGPAVRPAAEPAAGEEGDSGSLESVETRDGKRYRCRVDGYDSNTRSYLLILADGSRVSVPEADILTVRPATEARARPAPRAREAEAHPKAPKRTDHSERPDHSQRADHSEGADRSERADHDEDHSERASRSEAADQPEAADHDERESHSERTSHSERANHSERAVAEPSEEPPPEREKPRPAVREERRSAGCDDGALESLANTWRKLPAPENRTSLQALEEAVRMLRSASPLSAAEPLSRAIRAEPSCPTPAILLAALKLDVEKDAQEAFRLLTSPAVRGCRREEVPALLARAAGALGYRRIRDQALAESIELRYPEPERKYRLFQLFQTREPEKAQAAWKEYRAQDPRWDLKTPEAQAIREARESIEKGEPGEAISGLAAALDHNPLLESDARPLLERALLQRSAAARSAGKLEIALSDLRAVLDASPERKSEIEARLLEVEREAVKSRLAGATTVREAEDALASLAFAVPGAGERFEAEVREALVALAQTALSHEGFETGLDLLKAARGRGAVLAKDALRPFVDAVEDNVRDRDPEAARRCRALEEVAGDEPATRNRLERIQKDLTAGIERRGAVLGRDAGPTREAGPVREKAPVREGTPAREAATGRRVAQAADFHAEARTALPEIAGAAPAPDEGAADPRDLPYLPLEAGSQWVYAHGDGSREVQRIERVETLPDGRTVYRIGLEFQLSEAKIPYQKTGFFTAGYFQIAAGSRASAGEPILKVPAVVGERWSWRRGDMVFDREYTAVDVRVACRAGTFEDCLKVKATSRLEGGGVRTRPVVQWFYYAKGVGLVKIEGQSPLDGRELVEYVIGQDQPDRGALASPTRPAAAPPARPPHQRSSQHGTQQQGRQQHGTKDYGTPSPSRPSARPAPLADSKPARRAQPEDDEPALPAAAHASLSEEDSLSERDGEEVSHGDAGEHDDQDEHDEPADPAPPANRAAKERSPERSDKDRRDKPSQHSSRAGKRSHDEESDSEPAHGGLGGSPHR